MMAALDGRSDWFAPATSAIVFVLDGLGAHNLAARAGHARFLSQAGSKKDVARTVFPSTTASALTSLLTGTLPGEHGIVGYRALRPRPRRGPQPAARLGHRRPAARVAAREAADHRRGRASSSRSPSTPAPASPPRPSRGAEFHGADDLSERVELAADLAARHPGSFVYVYAPDLDAIGHRRGWQSDEWVAALERADAAARALDAALARGTGVVVTADHGMVDVPRHRHILLTEGDGLVDGVRHIGGEPRMLHLYAEPGAQDDVLAAWRAAESARSWVLSRDEAIERGPVRPGRRRGARADRRRAGRAAGGHRVLRRPPRRQGRRRRWSGSTARSRTRSASCR